MVKKCRKNLNSIDQELNLEKDKEYTINYTDAIEYEIILAGKNVANVSKNLKIVC